MRLSRRKMWLSYLETVGNKIILTVTTLEPLYFLFPETVVMPIIVLLIGVIYAGTAVLYHEELI